jgi:gliding motility-associated-like protein
VPTITYTISDGNGGTATTTLNITVTPVNDAPVAVPDTNTTPEDTPVSGAVLTNDSDIDGNPLTVTTVTIAGVSTPVVIGTPITITEGTIVINADGTYTFTPTTGFIGSVPTVTYTISDGNGGTATTTLNITVTPVNDAPVATDDKATTPEDTPVTIDIKTNDSDIEGDILTPSIIAQPKNGTAVLDPSGKLIYTPNPNFNGVDTVTYKICDNGTPSKCDTAIVVITVLAVADPVDINVNDTAFCIGGTAALKATSTTVSNPVFKWYGDAGLTNLLYTGQTYTSNALTQTSKYYVTVSGTGVLPNEPNNAKEVTVTVYPAAAKPTISVAGSTTLCPGGSVILSASIATTYTWYKDGVVIAGANKQSYTASTLGIYSVVTTNANGCPSAPSDGIVIGSAPVPSTPVILADKLTFCLGDAATLTSSSATGNQWFKDGVAITGANGASLRVTGVGSYTVISTTSNGCVSGMSAAVVITVSALPSTPAVKADGDLKICLDDVRKLNMVLDAGSKVQWFRNGIAISGATRDTLTVNETGRYTAVVTNVTGCVSDPSNPVLVEVVCKTGITMPDMFTPNGDGDNDEIMPVVPGIKRLRCFEVYNRWGNLVFTTSDMGKGWDGTYRGKLQPAETYLWNIEGVDSKGNKVKKTGMFTLIR